MIICVRKLKYSFSLIVCVFINVDLENKFKFRIVNAITRPKKTKQTNKTMSPEHYKLERWQGPPQINNEKQYEIALSLNLSCSVSLDIKTFNLS